MAGTMHKMAVYLGLVEDDPRYDEGDDSYEEYEDEYGEPAEPAEPEAERPVPRARAEFVVDAPRRLRARGPAAQHARARTDACHRSRPDHHLAPAHVQ